MELETSPCDLLSSLESSLQESIQTLSAKITLEGNGSHTRIVDKLTKKYPIYFKDTISTELRFPRAKLNHEAIIKAMYDCISGPATVA